MQTRLKARFALVLIGALAAGFFTVVLSNAAQIGRPKLEPIRFIAPDQMMNLAVAMQNKGVTNQPKQTNAANDIQVVVITAKRLSKEEKIAADQQAARAFQANAEFNKLLRKTV